jgi:3-isopropylmalate/(R)-2-methylmalate dehydratase small subunit
LKETIMNKSLVIRGRCHVFGDNVPLDEGVMAFKYAIGRVTDPKELIPHLFEGIDPTFAARVKPGDIVIAGNDFGCGKPHIQGFIAMAALGMGVLCGSMPYKALRGAVSKGLPVLTGCTNGQFAADGDEVEIDFASGAARNITQGTQAQFPAMAPVLRDIVSRGGAAGTLQAWLDEHPAQRAVPGSASAADAGTPINFVRGAAA